MTPIDWSLLARAKDFYAGRGYHYVETPWIASLPAVEATLRSPRFDVDGGCLVGSGEQGLLDLAMRHELPDYRWKFMTISPCFRDEPVEDTLHQTQFIKLELMLTGRYESNTETILDDAVTFFETVARDCLELAIIPTNEGMDITRNGIEIGSYGDRETVIDDKPWYWTYGTGLALPRFTLAV